MGRKRPMDDETTSKLDTIIFVIAFVLAFFFSA